MCLYPTLVKNPKYKSNKKNGGVIPPIRDKRVLVVPVGCGECMECRNQKAREIQLRLLEEIKVNKNGIFVSLTFSNEEYTRLYERAKKATKLEGYDLDNEIARDAVRGFTERWRKKYKKTIRHWLITELGHGETEHIHLHGILFIEPEKYIRETKDKSIKELQEECIKDRWQHGGVWCGEYVSERTISYITKYVTKVDQEHKYYKSKIFASKGIGANYVNTYNAKLNKYNGEKTREYYRTSTGHKIAIPTYWRNKIYSEDERELLWLNKLDQQKRYVNKKEIDISKTEINYYKALTQARKENRELGYGDGFVEWERKQYEKQRRLLMQKKRITAARGGLGKDKDKC